MPLDLLTLGAAFVGGLLGGVHCAAMCGGVAVSLSLAALPPGAKRPALSAATWINLGRIAGYVLAGALVGGLGAGLLGIVRMDAMIIVLRMLLGVVLVVVGLRLLGIGGRLSFISRPGAALWRRLAPLQRRLLPADSVPRRFALGMLWGWLPCGLSASLLFVAWLEADPLHGALVMASFGLGTMPTMLPLTWSGARAARWLSRPQPRRLVASGVLAAGLLTMTAPWLAQSSALHGLLESLGCRSLQ